MTWPTKTALAWDLAFMASVLTFIVSQTHLIPPEHVQHVSELSATLGFISGRFALSTYGQAPPDDDQRKRAPTYVGGGAA